MPTRFSNSRRGIRSRRPRRPIDRRHGIDADALSVLRGHTGMVMSVSFSPDSERLASGSRDHTMKVWDAAAWDDVPDR